MKIKNILMFVLACSFSNTAIANSDPVVGREAAAKYFQTRDPDQSDFELAPTRKVAGAQDHFLALHYGHYVASQSYEWGKDGQQDGVGESQFGLTYRVGEWVNSMDIAVRIDYLSFSLPGEKPAKLSFMPVLTFPDANSRFPLYFGVGTGLGVFLKQASGKSAVSLDYQLFAGARFFNVFENTGFFLEAGLKNHLHILSSGQFNGTFVATGLVFTF